MYYHGTQRTVSCHGLHPLIVWWRDNMAGDHMTKIGIIGGSGIYDVDALENPKWTVVDSPWGTPSDAILTGTIHGVEMAFLPRHGRGHVHAPTHIPYRANIDAMKRLGVTDIISVSACGSLREDMVPGDFVIIDQFIDRTFARDKSFFGTGCVAHVSIAHPTCDRLRTACVQAAADAGFGAHDGGTYLAMEGPQFSSQAESNMYRAWGCDVIGMTNMPEAKLAREAEICYATVAMVTDFDCWHPGHDAVDVADVIRTLQGNGTKAADLISRLPGLLTSTRTPCPQGCDHALDHAIMTAPASRDPALLAKLDAVAGRVL